jgi:uncharacterized protein (DUF1697 family)
MTVTRYVALLRGINVGRHNRIGMADLRTLIGGLGYADVRTHLASGNALFTSSEPESTVRHRLAAAVLERTGFDIACVVRTAEELARAAAANPFAGREPSRLFVTFLTELPAAVKTIDPREYEPDLFDVSGRDIYLYLPNGPLDTRLDLKRFETRFGTPATTRNWNTVIRLAELSAGAT